MMQLAHDAVFGPKAHPKAINAVVTATAKAAGFDVTAKHYNANGTIRIADLRKRVAMQPAENLAQGASND